MSSKSITIAQQIKCVERELALRKTVYPKWVFARRMSAETAEYEQQAMAAVLETLKGIAAHER